MNRRIQLFRSPIASLSQRIDALLQPQNDDNYTSLRKFIRAADTWVQEDLLARLGRPADRDTAADAMFRAWHELPRQVRTEITKLAAEENCAEQLSALVGNLNVGKAE